MRRRRTSRLVFTYTLAVQSPANRGAVLEAIRSAAAGVGGNRLRAAYAYVSTGGAILLAEALAEDIPNWASVRKRWLASFDWGHTDPAAVDYLGSLPMSEVRIPDAHAVLTRRLVPQHCFHPKTVIFDHGATANRPPAALVVGSGNLTVSGLQTGHESAAAAMWTPDGLSQDALDQLDAMRVEARRLDRVWTGATPLTPALLDQYRRLRRRRPLPTEDASQQARVFSAAYSSVALDRAAQLAVAANFWVEIPYVVRNRGPRREGNQIDLPRGSRAFFGLPVRDVPRNSFLGSLTIRYRHHAAQRHMRYGNNSMDKLDLPIPDEEGPPTYRDTVLRFERLSDGTFRLHVGTAGEVRRWRSKSRRQRTLYAMRSGREFGVFS